MVSYEHDKVLDKDIPVETKKIEFQLFLNLVTSSYLEHIKSCHEETKNIVDYHDVVFIVEEYQKEIDKVCEYYTKTNDIDGTLKLLKKVIKYPVDFTNCSMQNVIIY